MGRKRLALGLAIGIAAAALTAYSTGPGAGTASAQDPPDPECEAFANRVEDRTLDVWYGTVTIKDAGGATISTKDVVQLDQHVTSRAVELEEGVIQVFQAADDSVVDPRVKAGVSAFDDGTGRAGLEWAFDDPGTSADDWVITDPNPEQTLLNAYAAAGAAAGPGQLTAGAATADRRSIRLGTFGTGETAPVFVGDSDEPFVFGTNGLWVCITNDVEADVTFHLQDASYTLAPPRPTGDALCRQLSDTVKGSAKYGSASAKHRIVPDGLVLGACVAAKLVKPGTPAAIKRGLVLVFKLKVDLLRAGGWLSSAQATTLKGLADSL